jgi:hypothetical protein
VENIVVYALGSPFNVQPPDQREIWVTLSGRPADVTQGDDVRVSLAEGIKQTK